MRDHVSTTAVLCVTLVVSCPTLATTQPRFDSWTTENGLLQNSILDILQTRDGYLWLATEGGLVRFDGARFVGFVTDSCNTTVEVRSPEPGIMMTGVYNIPMLAQFLPPKEACILHPAFFATEQDKNDIIAFLRLLR